MKCEATTISQPTKTKRDCLIYQTKMDDANAVVADCLTNKIIKINE